MRRRRQGPSEPSQPFSPRSEGRAIENGIKKLVRRWLYYTVVKKYEGKLPTLDEIRYTLYEPSVWEHLREAAEMTGYTTSGYGSTSEYPSGIVVSLDYSGYHQRPFIPSYIWRRPAPPPDIVLAYAEDMRLELAKWLGVEEIYHELNRPGVSRQAAAYTFPPLATFLKLGNRPDPSLAELRRSPTYAPLPPHMVQELRTSIGLVARASLLPAEPEEAERDSEGGYTITLTLPPSKHGILPTVIYPW